MQSSALGFLSAQKPFTNPLVSFPSAVRVVFIALGGSATDDYTIRISDWHFPK